MAKEIGDGTTTATILAHAMVRGGVKAVAAELLEDTPGALWSHGSIEASRLRSAPQMTRVVVAIDPAVTSGEGADETGIVVAGKDQNRLCAGRHLGALPADRVGPLGDRRLQDAPG